MYGKFVHSCIVACALREWYRSQNCDTGDTTTTHHPVRYEAELHSCGTSSVREGAGGYILVTVCTQGDFITLPHWDIRPLVP